MTIDEGIFQEWANHPVTVAVRDLLITEIELSKERLIDTSNPHYSLEQNGLNAVAASAYIDGVQKFTDFNQLAEHLTGDYE